MVQVVHMKDVGQVQHPDWLVKAGIHDYHEWIMAGDDKIVIVYAKIMPGATSGAPVRHDWTEEASFVISGELVYEVQGRRVSVGANDSIFISRNEEHLVKNEGKEPALRISVHLKKEGITKQ